MIKPFIELHRHLEGSSSVNSIMHLAKKNRVEKFYDRYGIWVKDVCFDDAKTINQYLELESKNFAIPFEGFKRFTNTFRLLMRVVKDYNDLYYCVYNDLAEQSSDGAIHIELRISPFFWIEAITGSILFKETVFMNILKITMLAINDAFKHFKISSTPIISVSRHKSLEEMNQIVDCIVCFQENYNTIIGFDISGSNEEERPPFLFLELFNKLLFFRIPTSFHIAESSLNSQYIQDVILKLKVNRIAHGGFIYKNSQLLQLVKKYNICLELCPVSNHLLGYIPIEESPLNFYLTNGFNVTISTDDAFSFNTKSVNSIFEKFGKMLKINEADFYKLNFNALESAFITQERRESLRKILKTYYSENV